MADDPKPPVDPNFPRHLYKGDQTKIVHDAKTLAKDEAAGWKRLPPQPKPVDPDVPTE